MLGRINWRT